MKPDGAGNGDDRGARPTIRDVAALADVSIKTVSRVVNRDGRVSEALTARVAAAIEELNYRPNLAASRLRSGGANAAAIGLLVVDIGNPFSSTIHRAVEDVARAQGLAVLAASTDEDETREREAINAFTARRVDGLIVMPASHDHRYLAVELATGTPLVMIDRPPASIDVDAVVSDNVGGAALGVDALVAHGHRRIAYVGHHPDIVSAQQRFLGYETGLRTAGIALDPDLVHQGSSDPIEVETTVRRLLTDAADPPTALFLGQNLLCAPTIRALRSLDLHRQVAVIGFDGFAGADLVDPALTTVDQDPVEMGRLAAEVIFRRLAGDTSPPRVRVLPTSLHRRGSGEIPPSTTT
ncbi:MAG: LacI family DNA-binding transcriptional regulator [Nitriliruptoraceae bacterium]|nr:LacI family DNA-binding transcriptional regulator [Nitriliruptoraceae bacterium]